MAACETAPMVVEELPPPDAVTARELLVLPLSGLSSTVGGALGEKMAWGMREAGYPARSASLSSDTNPMLTGWIEEASDGGDIIWLNINWAVYGAGGTLLGNYRQEMAVSRDGWARLSSETLAVIVAQAVPAIHEIVEVEVYPDGMPEITATGVAASEIDLTPPPQETIVVSGEGLSRIDSSGIETMDQPLSVAAEPTFAPDYKPEIAMREDFPEGFASGSPVSSNGEAPSLPSGGESDGRAPGNVQARPKSTAGLVDDVGMLTPESAALVTTTPELTITETIDPFQDSVVDESLMELGMQPEEVGIAPGNGALDVPQMNPAVSQADLAAAQVNEPPPAPAASQQPTVPAAAINPQPALADGNAAQGFVRPVFLVRNITGAPGDGNLALRTAMLRALRNADAMVTDNPSQASYILQGSVQMAAPFAGRQQIRVIWLVTTVTGEEVGTAIQENAVPQGSLDGSWGGVAQSVANAAINGVAQLFDTRLDAGTAQGSLAQPDLPHVFGNNEP